ncbi:methionine adenosyltransferase [Patescibacteria group bacterium]|nr:methionine adenosyltransferase [Patescibacteria group bacterium]
MNNNIKLITSESVTEGHPDKVCDQISDAILDEMLAQDENTHAGIECLATTGLIVVSGEARTEAYVNIDEVVRKTLKKIGYDNHDSGFYYNSIGVLNALHEQSSEIAQGVDENSGEFKEQGAGDQGLMYGYASNETDVYMPLPIVLAHKLTHKLAELRKNGTLDYLQPDGKSQVTVEYKDAKVNRVDTVVIACQHHKDINMKALRDDIKREVIIPVLGDLYKDDTKIYINATGSFVKGGPAADAGLTGRKIIVDTYGGMGAHGGGAFSGKDPSKVDRSGTYMARHVAKSVVASNLADKCLVQVAYSIGVSNPVGIHIETYGTNKVSEDKIIEIINNNFSFKPKDIIEYLDLKKPKYNKTAAYGHFGRKDDDFTWEKIKKLEI